MAVHRGPRTQDEFEAVLRTVLVQVETALRRAWANGDSWGATGKAGAVQLEVGDDRRSVAVVPDGRVTITIWVEPRKIQAAVPAQIVHLKE